MTMTEETAEFSRETSLAPRAQFEIGGFQFDPVQRRLKSDRGVRELEPKVSELLMLLIEANDVVRRDDILDRLWGAAGSDEALTQTASKLRKALGDTARPYRLLETVPKVGYRLGMPGVPFEAVQPLEIAASLSAGEKQGALYKFFTGVMRRIRERKSFYKGVAFGAGVSLFTVAAFTVLAGPQSIEQEIDCPDHWSASECVSVIRAVID